MKQNLTELIYLREEEAMNLELSLNMVNAMKRYWKEFKSYSLAKNISYFDNNQIHLYLKDNYNCLLINNTNNLSKKQKEVIKAMLLLIDINNISKYTVITYKDIPLNDYYKEVLNNYLDFWQNIKNNSESTIKKKKIFTILFFNYLIDNNINDLKELNKEILLKYLDNIKNDLLSKKISIYWNLKSIFLYLNDSGILKDNFNLLIPITKRYKQKKLPSCFTKEDSEAIINAIKEEVSNTPAGYRNYAMFLMIMRLGIRKIDVINLKWENINWESNTITFIQSKTKKINTLPLPNDVGEAIIDYIKLERPIKIRGNDDYVFIRTKYPLVKLDASLSFNEVIKKSLIKCNIPLDKYNKIGTHSFRHSLATELINEQVPVTIIASILGHNNDNSTKTYLGINKKSLALCFIGEDYE